MRIPLVILAFFAFFAGALDLPWVHTHNLESFLAPVFAGTLYNDNLGGGAEWALAIVDIAAAVIGVIVAFWIWRGAEVYKPKLEPAFLQRVWYWDDFYDTVIGRPSQRLAAFCAWVVDARIIDGAVNGTASAGPGHRQRGPQAADRLRPQLRAGHRARDGPPHRLHAEQDVVGMTDTTTSLSSRCWCSLPAIGAAAARAARARPQHEEGADLRARPDRVAGHARLRHRHHGRHEGARRRLPAGVGPRVHGQLARRALVPRGRRHLHLPGAAHRACSSRWPSSSGATGRTAGSTSPGSCCSRRR